MVINLSRKLLVDDDSSGNMRFHVTTEGGINYFNDNDYDITFGCDVGTLTISPEFPASFNNSHGIYNLPNKTADQTYTLATTEDIVKPQLYLHGIRMDWKYNEYRNGTFYLQLPCSRSTRFNTLEEIGNYLFENGIGSSGESIYFPIAGSGFYSLSLTERYIIFVGFRVTRQSSSVNYSLYYQILDPSTGSQSPLIISSYVDSSHITIIDEVIIRAL